VDNMEYVNHKLTRKRQRQDKRELKQIGNQQKRSRERAALKNMLNDDLDFIPDFKIDSPSKWMNGLDYPNPYG
jgi:hypothetical protein